MAGIEQLPAPLHVAVGLEGRRVLAEGAGAAGAGRALGAGAAGAGPGVAAGRFAGQRPCGSAAPSATLAHEPGRAGLAGAARGAVAAEAVDAVAAGALVAERAGVPGARRLLQLAGCRSARRCSSSRWRTPSRRSRCVAAREARGARPVADVGAAAASGSSWLQVPPPLQNDCGWYSPLVHETDATARRRGRLLLARPVAQSAGVAARAGVRASPVGIDGRRAGADVRACPRAVQVARSGRSGSCRSSSRRRRCSGCCCTGCSRRRLRRSPFLGTQLPGVLALPVQYRPVLEHCVSAVQLVRQLVPLQMYAPQLWVARWLQVPSPCRSTAAGRSCRCTTPPGRRRCWSSLLAAAGAVAGAGVAARRGPRALAVGAVVPAASGVQVPGAGAVAGLAGRRSRAAAADAVRRSCCWCTRWRRRRWRRSPSWRCSFPAWSCCRCSTGWCWSTACRRCSWSGTSLPLQT